MDLYEPSFQEAQIELGYLGHRCAPLSLSHQLPLRSVPRLVGSPSVHHIAAAAAAAGDFRVVASDFCSERSVDMADEPSDACSHTNEGNAGSSRKRRRRASDACTSVYRQSRTNMRKAIMRPFLSNCFAVVLALILYAFADDEEEDDVRADILEMAVKCLAAYKVRIKLELGPNSGIAQDFLAIFDDAPDWELDDDDELNAYENVSSDDNDFASVLALPLVMKKEWILRQIENED